MTHKNNLIIRINVTINGRAVVSEITHASGEIEPEREAEAYVAATTAMLANIKEQLGVDAMEEAYLRALRQSNSIEVADH